MRSDVYFGVDLESVKSDIEITTVLSDVDEDYRVSPYRVTEEDELRKIDDGNNLRLIE